MAEDLVPDISGPQLSAAFRLGFFSRRVVPTGLVEAMEDLRTRFSPSVFRRLKGATERLERDAGSPGDRSESFVAMVRRAMGSANACRALYDLGESLGTYRVQSGRAQASDATPVWDCVRRIPEPLIRGVGCLFVLAEEADGQRDLDAALGRINQPWAELLATDDEDEFRRGMGTLSSIPTSWVQKALRAGGDFPGIMFVSEMTSELQSYHDNLVSEERSLEDKPPKEPADTGVDVPSTQDGLLSEAKRRAVKAPSRRQNRGGWAHEVRPPVDELSWIGPIEDTLKNLARYVGFDARTLTKMAQEGAFWVNRIHAKRYGIWFKNQSDYAKAKREYDEAHLQRSEKDRSHNGT